MEKKKNIILSDWKGENRDCSPYVIFNQKNFKDCSPKEAKELIDYIKSLQETDQYFIEKLRRIP